MMQLKYRRPDGTFVAIVDGQPYHAIADDPLFGQVSAAEIEALPLEPQPELSPEEAQAQLARAIDAHVEAQARALQYNSAAHLASYAASTVPEWAAEAQAFVAWRDQVWLAAMGMLAQAQETGEGPSVEEVIAALPEWVA